MEEKLSDGAQAVVNLFLESIALLQKDLPALAQTIEEKSEDQQTVEELRKSIPMLDQLKEWSSTLPAERFRETIFSFIRALDDMLTKAVRAERLDPTIYGGTEEHPTAPFIADLVIGVGPEITVSQDRMKVTMVLPKDFSYVWNADRIKAGLERQEITFGLDAEKIDLLVNQKVKKPVTIARGKDPEAGTDAILEDCLGLQEISGKPTVLSKVKTDLKDLNLTRDIQLDQVLMKKTPATPGVPGMDVYGEPIPCRDGEDIPFPPVPNTRLTEDGLALLSTVEGCAYLDGEHINIVESLGIKGNVDFATGNVKASVAVNVNGDVLSGFSIESAQDIVVKGTVEGARIYTKGNVFLPGGVQGKEQAVIRSGKNIDAKFINTARVNAEGILVVHGPVIQSRLRAKRIEIVDSGADIIGGIAEAVEDVGAETLGSDIGVKTVIMLGYDIEELSNKIEKLEQDIAAIRDKLKRYSEAIETLQKEKKKKGSISLQKGKILKKAVKSSDKAEELKIKKEEELETVREELGKSMESVRMVRAKKEIMPGVVITILDQTFTPEKPTGPATVMIMDGQIQVFPYQERSFAEEDEVE